VRGDVATRVDPTPAQLIAVEQDGRGLVNLCVDTLSVRLTGASAPVLSIPSPGGSHRCVALSPDARWVALHTPGHAAGHICVYHADSGAIVLGDMVWFSCAVLGLAALAQEFAEIFVAIRYAGAAYLLYLAVKLWRAPATATPAAAPGEAPRLFLGGLSLTLGNPKVIVFFVAILPNVLDIGAVGPLAYVELLGCIGVVLGGVMLAYALAASRARRAISDPRAIRIVNRATGGVMAGAAVAIVARA
jgi:threonine/homoserine/homoserine lactone efflux protein